MINPGSSKTLLFYNKKDRLLQNSKKDLTMDYRSNSGKQMITNRKAASSERC